MLADEGKALNGGTKEVGTRHEADEIMLDELDRLKNKDLSWQEWFAKYFTKPITGLKYKLGLGFTEAQELHKRVVRKFKRRRVITFNVNSIWASVLMHTSDFTNSKYKYLLNIIDLFSKYAYVMPLKSKSANDIIEGFSSVFARAKPEKLWTDQGTEFVNNKFKDFLKQNNIELYHVYNEEKSVVVERFNRTLGELLSRKITENSQKFKKEKQFVKALNDMVNLYDNKVHSTIGMTPTQAVKSENRFQVMLNSYPPEENKSKQLFNVGDLVRIDAYKDKFTKGRKPNWTKELFVVDKVLHTNPVTYRTTDTNGEEIIGSFYNQQLQRTAKFRLTK
jgi:hypothetical protein